MRIKPAIVLAFLFWPALNASAAPDCTPYMDLLPVTFDGLPRAGTPRTNPAAGDTCEVVQLYMSKNGERGAEITITQGEQTSLMERYEFVASGVGKYQNVSWETISSQKVLIVHSGEDGSGMLFYLARRDLLLSLKAKPVQGKDDLLRLGRLLPLAKLAATAPGFVDKWETVYRFFKFQIKSLNSLTVKGSRLYAGSDGGTFEGGKIVLLKDNGQSWEALDKEGWPKPKKKGYVKKVNCIVLQGQEIYAGTDQGIFRSVNNGLSWIAASRGLPQDRQTDCLLFHGPYLLAGIWEDGVYRSADKGMSWTPVGQGLPRGREIHCLEAVGQNLFAGTESKGIFLSSDNGESWKAVTTGLPTSGEPGRFRPVTGLAVNGTQVWAITRGGFFRSADNGAHWLNTATPGKDGTSLLCIAFNGPIAYAGTSESGVWRSPDNGATWTEFNRGFIVPPRYRVKFLAANGPQLIAGMYDGHDYADEIWQFPIKDLSGTRFEAEKNKASFAALKKKYEEGRAPAAEAEGLLFSFKEGKKYGFKDKKGKIVIAPQFSDVQGHFSEGVIAVSPGDRGGKQWGFIDTTGKWIIQPTYEAADYFSEGWAAVRQGGKYGYINRENQWQIKPQFKNAELFSEGKAAVLVNDKFGYIDKTGGLVIKPQFDMASPFYEGMAAVRQDERWGYIDVKGALIITPQFETASGMRHGVAEVKLGGRKCYVTAAGEVVPEP